MRKVAAACATLALAALGAVAPAGSAQASTGCDTAWRNAVSGNFHIYADADCGGLLARTAANDSDWGDASGPVRGVDVGEAGSLLHKGSPGTAVKLYASPGHTGAHVCLTRSEAYVSDLDAATFPDGSPLGSARSHRWVGESDCATSPN